MAIDTSRLPFSKGDPLILVRRAKDKAEAAEWARVCKKVDRRDKHVCQVTGKHLSPGAVDEWEALERHHLEPRSLNRSRRLDVTNVWSVSRGVHRLIHGGYLNVLDKHGEKAEDVREIYTVEWDYSRIDKGREPCSVMCTWRNRDAPLVRSRSHR
jgi:hypothetical protein